MTVTWIAIGIFLTVIAFVLVGFGWVYARGMRGATKRSKIEFSYTDAIWYLYLVLYSGYDGATLRLAHRPTKRALCFRKYISSPGEYGVALSVAEADLSTDKVAALQAHCQAKGFDFSTIEADGAGQEAEIRIDCGKDLDRAHELAWTVWNGLFDLTENTRIDWDVTKMTWSGELIDRRFRAPPGLRSAHVITTVLALVVSSVGLPVATLLSLGDPPDWTVTLGGVNAVGSTASLILLLVYAASQASLYRIRRRKSVVRHKRTRLRVWTMRTICLLSLALPAAVIAVWVGA